ncbi:hypothetical protein [Ethanoligenens harbinense]|uniref:Uncharacterized protein n=1 Tax=Ethanoligenens harbinense (strain DSM 18485 / JCM 12961 / CGMCC 1.5033 / YUAN-3) TaxID=663278 RepID=E6U5V8_ETHHY|nr:hypothetical protein [Ethanoligenens harbinense]ADU27975.1 hypothetical protein Ethha_2481 [Ethanoligenens harbinense YUAN-3]AVQ97501.1 hypothetical protein CXQ68_12735 [Ethanoligenens harbinense YUAN-3]AYF40156.1 hypothetical protein CXP51_12630 [Ethanoligenens harbinense]AYF42997.1 hypothetical protein CN246_13205 [Ethanoligenens harbinense]QCN93758.1 hypothetical protein DRA42_12780 [Ethanoligenens harbinense]
MTQVKRFSRKLLIKIEDLSAKGYWPKEISRKLKITEDDVKKGLLKIYKDELAYENRFVE